MKFARAALVLAAAALTSSVMVTTDPDLWGHLTFGAATLEAGAVSQLDPYSYTAYGQQWINHEWLAEVILAAIWDGAGAIGLWFLRFVLVAVTLWLAMAGVASRTDKGLAVVVAFLPAWLTIDHGAAFRPQLFTLAAFAVLVTVLRRTHSSESLHRAWLLGLAPMFGVWANLHGGFVAGLAVLAWAVVCDGVRATSREAWSRVGWSAAAVLAAILATLATPYGTSLWTWLHESLTASRAGRIAEWASVFSYERPLSLSGFFVLSVLVGAALLGRRRPPTFDATLLVATWLVACLQVRHAPLFAIVAVGPIARSVSSWLPERPLVEVGRRGGFMLLAGAVVFAVVAHLFPGRRPAVLLVPERAFPFGAFSRIARSVDEARLLVSFDWAQAAIHHLSPRCRVAFDGRFRTVYSREVEDDYFAFANGSVANARIGGEDATLILVPPTWRVTTALATDDEWIEVWRGANAVLFSRSGAHPRLEERRDVEAATAPDAARRFDAPLDLSPAGEKR